MQTEISEGVLCKYCGKMTQMTGTQMCDNCWEIGKRLSVVSIKTLRTILADVRKDVTLRVKRASK